MRVFLDTRPAPGGIQRSLDELVRRLSQRGGEVDLVLFRRAGGQGPAPVRLDAQPRSWARDRLGGLKRILEDQVGLRRSVRRAGVDLFVSPSGVVPVGLGCPGVLQCHDLWLLDRADTKPAGFVSRYERAAMVAALERADRIVVPSRSVLAALRERLPRLGDKAVHIYHPLPRLQVDEKAARDRPLPATPFLLTVGTLEPRKNLTRLVEAQREAWPRTRVPLVLVGPYGWRQQALLETVAQTAGVEWLGAVDEGTLDQLYRKAAAVVQVSLDEGFSYPVVEAMQRGAALVASDVPVHREIAGECATFCDPRSPGSIAAAIEEVLGFDSEQRRERADVARRSLELLRDDRLVERWLALFRELTGEPSSQLETGRHGSVGGLGP